MKLEQSFEVAAPLQRVWSALIDVERVAPCLPGASITGRNDDGSYEGSFKVRIGPTSASYTGKLQMENIDEQAHTATMQAAGTDKRGQGGAKATIVSSVSEAGAGVTKVDVATDYHITGRLARFGRGGMIEEISNRLLGEFAKSLAQMVAGEPEAAAAPEAAGVGADAVAAASSEAVPAASEGAPAASSEGAAAAEAAAPDAAAPEPVAPAEPVALSEPAEAEPEPVEAATASGVEAAPAAGNGAPPADASGEPEAVGTAEVLGTDAAAPDGNGAPSSSVPAPGPVGHTPPPENEPVQGLSLVASALWAQAKRNPLPLLSALVGFLLALRVFRRRN